ncbi:FHA domain-containing protein [Cohnella caldifontis]|uniref:FHA domain-containing protein n=1 Tax=Cohnella caldifontis TaxID=3027471 RepID=UPI0023EAF6FA|nr:FHA domain-containing protein [Cohnella sp. YIM B05605]
MVNRLPGTKTNRKERRRIRLPGTAGWKRAAARAGRGAFGFLPAMPLDGHQPAGFLPMAVGTALGTLPLLAALGIGIAIAVIAVIAFLQMTSRGREMLDPADAEEDPEEPAFDDREQGIPEGNPAERKPEASAAGGKVPAVPAEFDEEGAAADRTLPISRVSAMMQASAAEHGDGPSLHGIGGEFEGASFRINGRGLRLGRDPELCQVVFPPEIGEVSRNHCTVGFDEETRTFALEDHGSSNGTFLEGGIRLVPGKRYALSPGERFALSGSRHWFEVRD